VINLYSVKTLKLLASTLSEKGKFCRINKPRGLHFFVTLILIGAGEVHNIYIYIYKM
jgi:hypothetical protein